MSKCSSDDAPVLASKFIWRDAPADRIVLLSIGITTAIATLVIYFRLIQKHRVRGFKLLAANEVGIHVLPLKVQHHESVLLLGPIITTFYLMQLCVPELTTMADLFQTSYKAFAYVSLIKFISLQFGQSFNLLRDDGSGTLQQHKPCKIWNKPPLCCFWIFFLPLMKDRVVTSRDGQLVYKLVWQFCVIGPVLSAVKMVVHYEGVSADQSEAVGVFCDAGTVISQLSAVYAANVVAGIAEACIPLHEQLKKRHWFSHGHKVSSDAEIEEPTPIKNIQVKNTWIVIATVLPVVAGLVISLSVKDGLCEQGRTLAVDDRQNFYIAFVALLLNFLAALFATVKAFPLPNDTDRTESIEHISARYIEMEIWPEFALRDMASSVNGVLEDRQSRGIDVNLGVKPSPQWMNTFGVPGTECDRCPEDINGRTAIQRLDRVMEGQTLEC